MALPIKNDLKAFLPTTRKEVEIRGWEQLDVILFSGDAYVDHPSFGAAVIGRVLESMGLKVGIVPQPNWRDDLRDFTKLGTPRYFFGVSPGAMDSMVNHYTASKRLRSDDAYTPDGKSGMRPDYPSIVYTQILKKLYPDTPIILGGIESSMRRLAHYDYWQDRLRPSILIDSHADLLIYGMGELPIKEIVSKLQKGASFDSLHSINQVVYCTSSTPSPEPEDIYLASYDLVLQDKRKQAANFKLIEESVNSIETGRLIQPIGDRYIVVNPSYPPMTTAQVDSCYDLPYTRLPHPKYKAKTIPAYEMIRHSVNLHRGCFGGCSFCAIAAHQGKHIASRSEHSILSEVQRVTQMEDFKGYISDLGAPSANMYQMKGENSNMCRRCKRPSCIWPQVCKNLQVDHQPLIDLYKKVDQLPGIKKSFVGSGIRYDLLLLHHNDNPNYNAASRNYLQELVAHHTSGRLKVAPEHTNPQVLECMRKNSFDQFYIFKRQFDRINQDAGLRQQLIPYFISSHPGSTEESMAELAVITKELDFHLEQVQDFTPTPMTLSTEMYYTGINPYSGKPLFTAKTIDSKRAQRQYFFWYQPENRAAIKKSLQRLKRPDLISKLY